MKGDRNNFSGDLEMTAPTGGVVRGKAYEINGTTVVARSTADAGDTFLAALKGPIEGEKSTGTGTGLEVGEKVGVSGNVFVVVATGVDAVGTVIRDADTADDVVLVDLGLI